MGSIPWMVRAAQMVIQRFPRLERDWGQVYLFSLRLLFIVFFTDFRLILPHGLLNIIDGII